MKGVVFVGPRAVGKTTLGRSVAAALGWEFADTDELLAAAVGCPAGEYLATQGEPAFRTAEEPIVRAALAANAGRVLSLGGGAILAAKVREDLTHPAHFVVFLSAPVSVLAERLMGDEGRPRLTDRPLTEEVETLYRQRFPLYREVADLVLDTNSANVDGCREVVLSSMGEGRG